MPIKNNNRAGIPLLLAFIGTVILQPVKDTHASDCDQGTAEARRLYSMALEQSDINPRASEDFLLSAQEIITGCEYNDSIKEELYTALGQLYYRSEATDKAIGYLEMALESGMNIESPNSFPAILLGNIYAERYHTDANLFPRALLNYKKALQINNFASSALTRQAESKYNLLAQQTAQMEETIWEMARAYEAQDKWDMALACYNSLDLLGRYDKLSYYKSRARFNIHLSQTDAAMVNSNFNKAGQALDKAKATKYYSDGHGQKEFDKRFKRLKKHLK